MISITLNDETISVPEAQCLSEILEQRNLASDSLALVLNGRVVPKKSWAHIACQSNDRLEIFSVVAGG